MNEPDYIWTSEQGISGNLGEYQVDIKKLEANMTREDILVNLMKSYFFNDGYLHAVTSEQNVVRSGLPNRYRSLKGGYIEYRLFDVNPFKSGSGGVDAITNISFHISSQQLGSSYTSSLPTNFKGEVVLKINDNVICSKVCKFGEEIKFISFPNIIILFIQTSPTVSIYLRAKAGTLPLDAVSELTYDPLYFSHTARQIVLKINNYTFKTTMGTEVRSILGLYGIMKFSDLYNSVDDEFKILYDSMNTYYLKQELDVDQYGNKGVLSVSI
jgi:hypothetical protein